MQTPRPVNLAWIPRTPLAGTSVQPSFAGRIYQIKAWRTWSDAKKVSILRELAEEEGHDPGLRVFVVNQILRPAGVEPRNYRAQAAAILAWVQKNIYYTNEPGEQVQTPQRTLEVKTGDCDDLAVLLGTLYTSIHLPWRFVLAGKNGTGRPLRWIEGTRLPPRTTRFYHIYIRVGTPPFRPTQWFSAEPTMGNVPLGYDPVIDGPRGARTTLPELAGAFITPGEDPWYKRIDWSALGVRVLEGTITAVLIQQVLARMRKK